MVYYFKLLSGSQVYGILYCTDYKECIVRPFALWNIYIVLHTKKGIIRPFGLWNIYIVLPTRNVLSGPLAYGIFILYCIQGMYYQAHWLMEYLYCTAYKESIIRPFGLWNIHIVLHTRKVLSGLLDYGIFILYCIQGMYYQAFQLMEYLYCTAYKECIIRPIGLQNMYCTAFKECIIKLFGLRNAYCLGMLLLPWPCFFSLFLVCWLSCWCYTDPYFPDVANDVTCIGFNTKMLS